MEVIDENVEVDTIVRVVVGEGEGLEAAAQGRETVICEEFDCECVS